MSRPAEPTEHPSPDSLADLAAGELSALQRALLESHLHFCIQCRERVAQLASLPTALMAAGTADDEGQPDRRERGRANEVWLQIERRLDAQLERVVPFGDLPIPRQVLAELDPPPTLEWTSFGASSAARATRSREPGVDLFLVFTPPGGTFPHHRHVGGEELVILQGGMADHLGHMGVGDYRCYPAGTAHAPIMDPGKPCIGLALVRGGLDFTIELPAAPSSQKLSH